MIDRNDKYLQNCGLSSLLLVLDGAAPVLIKRFLSLNGYFRLYCILSVLYECWRSCDVLTPRFSQ